MAFVAGADGGTRGTPVRGWWSRWEPVTGVAFVVLFVVAFYINQAPGDGASNAVWLKTYANSGNQILFVVSGFMLVIASLCLLAFVNSLWSRIAAARRPQETSRLPRAGAGLAAAQSRTTLPDKNEPRTPRTKGSGAFGPANTGFTPFPGAIRTEILRMSGEDVSESLG